MPIPTLQSNYLPEGIYDCSLEELTCSPFCENEKRRELFSKLQVYIQRLREFGIEGCVILDGSFVTAKEHPNDIDIVLVINENQNYSIASPVTNLDYTLFNDEFVKENFELHLFIGFTDNNSYNGFDTTANEWIEFFKGVRESPVFKKGLLMVRI